MKFAVAIINRFSRVRPEQEDAFDRRLSNLGAQKMSRKRAALPSLFIRHIHA